MAKKSGQKPGFVDETGHGKILYSCGFAGFVAKCPPIFLIITKKKLKFYIVNKGGFVYETGHGEGGSFKLISEQEWLQMFSSNLSSLMSENWMTQTDLAEESGISKATINKYVNGTQMPKASAIVNLAYALHCDVSELIDFGDMVEW